MVACDRTSPLRVAVGQAQSQIEGEAIGTLPIETQLQFRVLNHRCTTGRYGIRGRNVMCALRLAGVPQVLGMNEQLVVRRACQPRGEHVYVGEATCEPLYGTCCRA